MTDTQHAQLTAKAQELVTFYKGLDPVEKIMMMAFLEADGVVKESIQHSLLTELKSRMEKLDRRDYDRIRGYVTESDDGIYLFRKDALDLIDQMLAK
jgi:hypothetical protein